MPVVDSIDKQTEVCRCLQELGFTLANFCGFRYEEIPTSFVGCIGLLFGDSTVKTPGWRRRRRQPWRMNYIANLWMENPHRDASLNKRWVLETTGIRYMRELESAVAVMTKKFGVEIVIRRQDLREEVEGFVVDFYNL